MADWSDIPQDLFMSLAQQGVSFQDFIVLGAVCKSWRSDATKENFTGQLTHELPFLMLPENAAPTIREFYSLTKGLIFKLNLPEAEGKLCYSSLGWLITKDLKFNLLDPLTLPPLILLHPLNHAQIKLPEFKIFDHFSGRFHTPIHYYNIIKFVLSSSPSWTSDYTVMVFHKQRSDDKIPSVLAFCRPRDDEYWTSIAYNSEHDKNISDLTYYNGQFYVVDLDGNVLVCDTEDSKQPCTRIVVPKMPRELLPPMIERSYLVESRGDLLVVFCQGSNLLATATMFRVFKVPFSNGNWGSDSEINNLGNRTLFLGDNSSCFSVETSHYYSGCKPNCIYFVRYTNRRSEYGQSVYIDMGIFNMEDGKIEYNLVISPEFYYCVWNSRKAKPYLWIQPSF